MTDFVYSYADKLSYQAGEAVTLYVSASTGTVDVKLVKITDALGPNNTPPSPPKVVAWDGAGTYPAKTQQACVGSFGRLLIAGAGALNEYTLGATVWLRGPAVPEYEAIVSVVDPSTGEGPALVLSEGKLAFAWHAGETKTVLASVSAPLAAYSWYSVSATVAGASVTVRAIPVDLLYGVRLTSSAELDGAYPADLSAGLTVGAVRALKVESVGDIVRGLATYTFNGKIEAPYLSGASADATPIVQADFAPYQGLKLHEIKVAGGTGCLVNSPTRAMTGSNWDTIEHHYKDAVDQYGAVAFHDTDIVDCGWEPILTKPLPGDLPSALYGLQIAAGDKTDVLPLIVTPGPGQAKKRIAYVLPTFQYLAYANEMLYAGELDWASVSAIGIKTTEFDDVRTQTRDFGPSLYDTHTDGSGVSLSSARRPILNHRHDYPMWLVGGGRGLSGDTYLIEWLDKMGYEFDVLSDHEVHAGGYSALAPYSVVVTGGHPEYTSVEMLDGYQEYRDEGGRIMYLGGNGFYWVTAVMHEDPLTIEIRRGFDGIRSWSSDPGEVDLFSTRRPGGLWRHRGRPPQKLVGTGFAAQGWGPSRPYKRFEPSFAGEHAWIFEGVDEDPVGAYGYVQDGAAGDELDRYDFVLGTPTAAVVLASSFEHSNHMQRVIEEIPMNLDCHGGGLQDPEVKADIVYFATPGGGEVFSTSSIAWDGALLVDDAKNGVSRLTSNVLTKFAAGPSPYERAASTASVSVQRT